MKIGALILSACALLGTACINTSPVHDAARRFIPCPDSSREVLPTICLCTAGIRAVVLPTYLDSSKIAVRSGGSELVYSDLNLWSEPLATSASRLLAERMRLRIGQARVDVFPYTPGVSRDVEFRVEFDHFEGNADGTVRVVGRFVATKSAKDEAPAIFPFDYRGNWTVDDYASLAKALGNAIDDLAGDIVKKL
jgi:uncharacterized protein